MFFSSPLCRSNDQVGRDVCFFSFFFPSPSPIKEVKSPPASVLQEALQLRVRLTLGLRVLGANHHREPFFFFFATLLLLRLHPVWSPPDSRGHGGEARRSWALCRDQRRRRQKEFGQLSSSLRLHMQSRAFLSPFLFISFLFYPPETRNNYPPCVKL